MIERFVDVVRRTRQSLSITYILFTTKKSFGDWSDGGTPGHIPNPAVKAVSADGTWGAAPWESRSLPKDFFCLRFFLVVSERVCKRVDS